MSNNSWTDQEYKMDEEIAQIHQLYEAAKPQKVTSDKLTRALKELYEASKKKFDTLWRKPDGSRVFQLLFRRGDDDMRNQLITDFEPILLEVAKKQYSFFIVKYMITNGSASQRDRIFKILKGHYDSLLTHKIGRQVIEVIYDYSNLEQKSLLYLDFYGPQWKKCKTPISLEEICKKGKVAKDEAIKNLTNVLSKMQHKNFGNLKLTQKLLLTLGQVDPTKLSEFAVDFKEYCFSSDGTQAAIIAFQNAQPNQIKYALKFIEPNPREPVLGIGAGAAPAIPAAAEYEEEEEEEEQLEGQMKGQIDEEGEEAAEAPEESEYTPGSITASIANDQNAWRALCCAISYNTDISVIKDEVLPNLLDQWDKICCNKNALQLLLRFISVQPSVFHDLTFQKSELNEDLKKLALPLLANRALDSLNVLGTMAEGSQLVATLMKNLTSDPLYARFAEAVFTPQNVVDKVMHKMVRYCVKVIGKEASKLALETVKQVGFEEVLKTPGAWIVKEILTTENNKKLETQIKNIIKKNDIQGPAIESILNPSAQKIQNPKKRFDKKESKK